jgi:hypothetical protein
VFSPLGTKLTPTWKRIKRGFHCKDLGGLTWPGHLEIFMPGFSGVNPIFALEAPPAAVGFWLPAAKMPTISFFRS